MNTDWLQDRQTGLAIALVVIGLLGAAAMAWAHAIDALSTVEVAAVAVAWLAMVGLAAAYVARDGAPQQDPLGEDGDELDPDAVRNREGDSLSAGSRWTDLDIDIDTEAIVAALTSFRAKALYFLLGVAVAVVGILAISWIYAGPISTIVYLGLFLFTLTLFPILIGLFGNGVPMSNAVGKAHIILGAFAFGHHYLVQLDDKWEWCPGDETRVYLDGEWHDIAEGHDNKSVLGWRPFGILRYKDEETLANVRADIKGERVRGASADGGSVERAGYQEVRPEAVSGIDGEWLVDLKRVYTRGLRKMGDVELIETAEELIERGQVDGDMMGGMQPMITFIVSLLIGIITGYLFLVA